MKKFKRILLVDDDPEFQMLITPLLKGAGFSVRSACDGISGLAAAQRDEPDLVILDLCLPGNDGEQALFTMRRTPSLAQVPVLIVSSRDAAVWRGRLLAIGADAYLQKPVDPLQLVACVRELLQLGESRALVPICPHCRGELVGLEGKVDAGTIATIRDALRITA